MTKNNRYIIWSAAIFLILMHSGCRSSHKKVDIIKEETVNIIKKNKKSTCNKIVKEAITWIDTPYKYASSEKGKGTDCSGMVCKVYEDVKGIKLPRNSKKQSEYCKKLNKKDVKPGDLVFFATGKDKHTVSHVGIMIDHIQFIHASTKKGVIISEVTTPYYERTFIMYGRVPQLSKDD